MFVLTEVIGMLTLKNLKELYGMLADEKNSDIKTKRGKAKHKKNQDLKKRLFR